MINGKLIGIFIQKVDVFQFGCAHEKPSHSGVDMSTVI